MKNVKNMMAAILMIFTIAINAQTSTTAPLYTTNCVVYGGLSTFTTTYFNYLNVGTCTQANASLSTYATPSELGHPTNSNGTGPWQYGFAKRVSDNNMMSLFTNTVNGLMTTIQDTGLYVVGYKNGSNTVYTWVSQTVRLSACSALIPTVTANFVGASTVCAGSSLNFTNTSLSSVISSTNVWASKFVWSATNGTTVINAPVQNPVFNNSVMTQFAPTFQNNTQSPINYTVTLIASNCSGPNSVSSTKTVVVTVYPIPVISVSNHTVCNGSSAVLSASGCSTYSWSTPSATVTPTANTTYTVNGSSNGCSAVQTTVSVSVIATPSVVSIPNATVCSGSSATLAAFPPTSYTLAWSSGSVVAPSTTSIYTVTATALNGCTSTKNVTVTVNSLPSISIGGSLSACAGQAINISASGATSYTWSNGATTASIGLNSSVVTTSILSVTGSDGICSNTASATVQFINCTDVGISVNYMRPSFNVYPNPSAGVFNIDYKGNVEIFDASGNLVMSREVDGIVEVDLSPGLYIVRFDGKYNHKIIKQH